MEIIISYKVDTNSIQTFLDALVSRVSEYHLTEWE
jgi:hypothetical protein